MPKSIAKVHRHIVLVVKRTARALTCINIVHIKVICLIHYMFWSLPRVIITSVPKTKSHVQLLNSNHTIHALSPSHAFYSCSNFK